MVLPAGQGHLRGRDRGPDRPSARTNNIEVTSPSGRRVRLPGQGGMADVADLHRDFILYLTRHSRLSLVDSVERTSASRALVAPAERRRTGLVPGEVALITNLGAFVFDPGKGELVLESVHPGVDLDEVRRATGFEPVISSSLHETDLRRPRYSECSATRSTPSESDAWSSCRQRTRPAARGMYLRRTGAAQNSAALSPLLLRPLLRAPPTSFPGRGRRGPSQLGRLRGTGPVGAVQARRRAEYPFGRRRHRRKGGTGPCSCSAHG